MTTKSDPSRTATLRRVFSQDMNGRFLKLRKLLRDLVVVEDAFGLRPRPIPLLNGYVVSNTRWAPLSSNQKISEFQKFLREQMNDGILEVTGVETDDVTGNWTQGYVAEAYAKGQNRAFTDVRKPSLSGNLDFFEGTRSEFLRQSFAQPIAIERVNVLASRVFTDLKGVTESMATTMNRTLTDGLIRGDNPNEIARQLNKDLKIGANRAKTIARTETIRAHAEGQLDALERLGVEDVGVAVEWSTAGDDRVCPLCQPLEGVVMKLKEARGILPRHPNCRCAFIPDLGESNKRSKKKVEKAIDRSISAERPKRIRRSLEEQRRLSRWLGADASISKKRPESILVEPKRKKKKKKKAKQSVQEASAEPVRQTRKIGYAENRKKWKESLSKAEKDSIEFWSRQIDNVQQVRLADQGKDTAEWAKDHPKTFLNTIAKAPAYKGTVYRGLGMDAANVAEARVGSQFSFPTLASASKNSEVAEEFMEMMDGLDLDLVVYKVEATNGKDISDLVVSEFLEQEEVLIQKSSKFTITDKKWIPRSDLEPGGYHQITLTELES